MRLIKIEGAWVSDSLILGVGEVSQCAEGFTSHEFVVCFSRYIPEITITKNSKEEAAKARDKLVEEINRHSNIECIKNRALTRFCQKKSPEDINAYEVTF